MNNSKFYHEILDNAKHQIKILLKLLNYLEKKTHYFLWEHLSALRFNSWRLFVRSCCCQSRYIVYRASSHLSTKKGKKKTDQCGRKLSTWLSARFKKSRIVRSVRFCIAVSLYPVWADVDAIYQVLKQAGEIRGNSTNSPPTPPTAEHPPSGAAPSSARASSHPCSSSTSGKAHYQEFLPTLERTSEPRKFSHVQWRITCATFTRISRLRISCSRISSLYIIYITLLN